MTVEAGGTVFYRRRDIESLIDRLRRAGHAVDIDFREGTTPEDLHVDVPPYTDVHLRTQLGWPRDHLTRPDRHEGLGGARADPLAAATRAPGLNDPGLMVTPREAGAR